MASASKKILPFFIFPLCLCCCTNDCEKNPWFVKKLAFNEINNKQKVFTPKIGLLDSGLFDCVLDNQQTNIKLYSNEIVEEDNNFNEHGTIVYHLCSMLCPDAEYYIVRVLNNGGFTDEKTIIEGLNILKKFNCDIINMSFGSSLNSNAIGECIDSFDDSCLFISSIGDRNLQSFFYPAKYERVIPVGATNRNGIHYELSNADDVNALWFPGVDLEFEFYGNNYVKSGSSYASALACGYIALLESRNVLNRSNLEKLDCYTDDMLDITKLITSS